MHSKEHLICLKILFYCAVKNRFHSSKKCWVVSTQIWAKYGQPQMLG